MRFEEPQELVERARIGGEDVGRVGVAGVRRFGAAALDLAFVAAGRFDGFWERDLGAWDLAAGTLLVTEAGGKITTAEGGDDVLGSGSICAANLDLHPLLLERLKAAA